jgi:oligoribonuclease (3'-5' exoribonuclease)
VTDTKKIFCFIDLETTGLDEELDRVLEVAWTFTDSDFLRLYGDRTYVIDHENDWGSVWSMLKANDFVTEMHTKSGLVADMLGDETRTLDAVWESLRDDLLMAKEDFPDATIHFAGDSVWFDRQFLNHATFRHMLNEHVHHRLLDLSSIKVMLEAIGRPVETSKGDHRALNDVWASLDTARVYAHLGRRAVVE